MSLLLIGPSPLLAGADSLPSRRAGGWCPADTRPTRRTPLSTGSVPAARAAPTRRTCAGGEGRRAVRDVPAAASAAVIAVNAAGVSAGVPQPLPPLYAPLQLQRGSGSSIPPIADPLDPGHNGGAALEMILRPTVAETANPSHL